MKPSFALNLTEEGVTLLHRTARGWLDVGSVAFSDPDLPAALDYLRSTALGLSPKGIATKLVIPPSQILYLEVEAPGPDDDARRAQIASALEGRTPYDVSDLAYDWRMEGTTAHVAVVARETLAEAEGFAVEHRLNPVSFVAIPPDHFRGEPFFGPSALAPSLLAGNQTVQPDSDPIAIITREMPKDDAAAVAKGATPEPVPAPEPEPVPEPEPAPEPEPERAPEPEPEPAPAPPAPAPKETPAPEPHRPAPAPPEMPPARQPDPAPAPAFDPPVPPVTMSATSRPAKPQEADEAPMAVDVPVEDEPAKGEGRVTSTAVDAFDDLPPAPSSAALMAFASRRAGEVPPPPARGVGAADSGLRNTGPATNAAPPLSAVPGTGGGPAVATGATRQAPPKPVVERPAAARPAPKFSYDDPVPPPPRLPGDPPVTVQTGAVGKASKGLRNLGALVTAPSISGGRKNKPMINGSAAAAAPVDDLPPPPASAVSRPTLVKPDALAKGLSARNLPQRGKPRYLGLILTGVLLLILALIAAWSSFYLTQNAAPEPDPVALSESDVPAPDDEMLADLQDPEALASDSLVADGLVADSLVETGDPAAISAPGAVDPALVPDATLVAEPAPDAGPAPEVATAEPAPATGVDPEAATAETPNAETQDEIFLAGMDTPPALSDPLVLTPPAAAGDVLPAPQMPPPPFGTVYTFDENGLIQPTPEGIMTPEGVLLVSGRPPVLPPARPASISAVATAAAEAAAAPAPATVAADAALLPEETFAADPTLSAARPRTRPPELTPAAPAGGEDDASLAPAEDSRFASLRPRLRPTSILAAGEAARLASQSASLAASAAAASAAAEAAIIEASANAAVSPQAVAVSRVPAPRPRDLSRAVEAAVAAATQPAVRRKAAPEPEPEPQPNARTNDEADDEPEVATTAPRIPTKASVAKQATFVNAINLSKTNLIGVYGTQSKRYALVRQSNGRYKKLRVGDSIDGGKVQAITSNEVRYQKGGRLIALAMPKG